MTEHRPIAVVTGASSGLGEEFARQLARKGYHLVLVARRKERLQRLAEGLAQEHGTAAEVMAADLSQAEDLMRVQKRLSAGDVEVLVNSAGFGTRGEFARLPVEREMEEIELNVKALALLSHAALAAMAEKRRGRIINLASTAAFQPVPYMTTYAATKAFVLHFCEGLHEEARRYGVSVTAVCPGPVRTEFQDTAGVDQSRLHIGWTDAGKVVASALRAAEKGRAISTPGLLNRLSAVSARVAPRWLTRKVAGTIFRNAGAGGTD